MPSPFTSPIKTDLNPHKTGVPIGSLIALPAATATLVTIDGCDYLRTGYAVLADMYPNYSSTAKVVLADGNVNYTDMVLATGYTMPTTVSKLMRHSGTRFVAVGHNSSYIYHSSDNWQTWSSTSPTGGTGDYLSDAVELGGKWLAAASVWYQCCAYRSVAYTSSDGVAWTAVTLAVSGYPTQVAISPSRYVVADSGPNMYSSVDGVSWNVTTINGTGSSNGAVVMHWDGTRFIAMMSATRYIAHSLDGLTWTTVSLPTHSSRATPTGGERYSLAVSPNMAIATLSELTWYSTDHGVTWVAGGVCDTYTNSNYIGPTRLIYDGVGGGFFGHDDNNPMRMYYTSDGVTWYMEQISDGTTRIAYATPDGSVRRIIRGVSTIYNRIAKAATSSYIGDVNPKFADWPSSDFPMYIRIK